MQTPERLKTGLKRIFPWLLGVAYLPSFLFAPVAALGFYGMRHKDLLIVCLVLYNLVSYALPLSLLWVHRTEQLTQRRWPRFKRIATWLVALNCYPHTVAVAVWGLMAGIERDGLVP